MTVHEPFANSAVSSDLTDPTPKTPRFAEHIGHGLPYKRMNEIEGVECLLHEFEFSTHPEYGDSYRSVISIPEEGDQQYVCYLRGTAILRKCQECVGRIDLPVAFKLIKPAGKTYWDFV